MVLNWKALVAETSQEVGTAGQTCEGRYGEYGVCGESGLKGYNKPKSDA